MDSVGECGFTWSNTAAHLPPSAALTLFKRKVLATDGEINTSARVPPSRSTSSDNLPSEPRPEITRSTCGLLKVNAMPAIIRRVQNLGDSSSLRSVGMTDTENQSCHFERSEKSLRPSTHHKSPPLSPVLAPTRDKRWPRSADPSRRESRHRLHPSAGSWCRTSPRCPDRCACTEKC